jgi:hypothetical protein
MTFFPRSIYGGLSIDQNLEKCIDSPFKTVAERGGGHVLLSKKLDGKGHRVAQKWTPAGSLDGLVQAIPRVACVHGVAFAAPGRSKLFFHRTLKERVLVGCLFCC